jgi:hypothetical protein
VVATISLSSTKWLLFFPPTALRPPQKGKIFAAGPKEVKSHHLEAFLFF